MHISKGEILGIAGESGSGKTMSAYAIDGILPQEAMVVSGQVLYDGVDLLQLPRDKSRIIQGREFGMVFQRFSYFAKSIVQSWCSK